MLTFSDYLREQASEVTVERPATRNPSFDDEMEFRLGDAGVLRVAKNKASYTDWSVTEIFVDEASRRQGLAARLIDKMKETLTGTIGAQASNDGSVQLFWDKGFRSDGTLQDALNARQEYSSVNLIYDPSKT